MYTALLLFYMQENQRLVEENARLKAAVHDTWKETIIREHTAAKIKVELSNEEYYLRTGRKPTPYWEMPY